MFTKSKLAFAEEFDDLLDKYSIEISQIMFEKICDDLYSNMTKENENMIEISSHYNPDNKTMDDVIYNHSLY